MAKTTPARNPAPLAPSADPSVAALIEEIDQEVKAKQTKDFFKRHGKAIGMVVAAVIIGTAIGSTWSAMQRQKQGEDSEKLIVMLDQDPGALSEDDIKNTLKTYVDLGENGAGEGQRVIARLAEAGTLFQRGEYDTAIARLKEMQKNSSIRPIYRDYALLMELRARMDKDEPQQVLDDMKPLLDPKNPWYLSALEASAVLYAKMGKNEDALAQLQGIVATPDAPLPSKERANNLMRLYTAK